MLSFAIEVFNLLNPLFIQYVTDDVIGSSDMNNLYVIASAFIILTCIQVFTEYIRGHLIIYLTNNLTEKFSANVVNHILKLPLDFFEKRHKGDIQSKFHSIDQIQKKISTDFVNAVLDGFMLIINFLVILLYSYILTSVVLLSLSICLLTRYLFFYSLRKETESSIVQHAKSASIFLETLQGIIPIKSFSKERVRFHTWRNSYVNSLNADIKIARINVIYQGMNQLLFHLEPIVVICVGSALVLNNKFSAGMLIAFLAYRQSLVNKATSLMQNLIDYKLISIQLNRLGDILFQEPETISSGIGNADEMKGALSLRKVNFKYDANGKMILNNISLDIKAGEKVALVGPSGCGKSTLLKIMMGLLNKTTGDIYIDSISLNDFGLKNYRELTASVMQEDSLLTGSIIDNITFFSEAINLDDVCRAAKLACIHEEICKLPMGYETLVGDMGSTLSGGQKQRILLARALYKKPKILFMDEATSHLDIVNERNINQTLQTLAITQVVIAHRIETIQMADRVIDLNKINQFEV
ncbi:ABC transporter [Legionella hackeliae]|uniref:peptidase domain-containing ABC transporter n=1 Tax=Legionella hackeliae TaxID=449 RepID=UPI000E12F9A1|nr:ABC transporter [Legionella hackeliae]